jgi:hypothetical protein
MIDILQHAFHTVQEPLQTGTKRSSQFVDEWQLKKGKQIHTGWSRFLNMLMSIDCNTSCSMCVLDYVTYSPLLCLPFTILSLNTVTLLVQCYCQHSLETIWTNKHVLKIFLQHRWQLPS